jgi:hypothetical protein
LDRKRLQPFAYFIGAYRDGVTEQFRQMTTWRDVADLDMDALVRRIRADEIDILVDLTGHTRGNRLAAFAQGAAPVQLSWLGYYGTTGVAAMDYVLMDAWHVPPGSEKHFTERVVRLPHSRFCYQPVPFAPPVAPLPCRRNGHVTFGSFNNTAKLNPEVFAVWAAVLNKVPNSKLVLKWRSLMAASTRQALVENFARHGVAADRLDLRPASPHDDLLAQYGDIDIALDPFPFSGGHTSCEALWMGVPVVTWPHARPVSRQTLSLIGAMGKPEWLDRWVATSAEDYGTKAAALAADADALAGIRAQLRDVMRRSPLMDGPAFAKDLTQILESLMRAHERSAAAPVRGRVLCVGSAPTGGETGLPACFQGDDWQEVQPEVPGGPLDVGRLADESLDAVYAAHHFEHLYAHEVEQGLADILRVLKPTGFLLVTCPDLQAAAQQIASDKLTEAVYQSPAGPITPLDILYGFRPALAKGELQRTHKCGFTETALLGTLQQAGFATVATIRHAKTFELSAIATKQGLSDVAIRALALRYLRE